MATAVTERIRSARRSSLSPSAEGVCASTASARETRRRDIRCQSGNPRRYLRTGRRPACHASRVLAEPHRGRRQSRVDARTARQHSVPRSRRFLPRGSPRRWAASRMARRSARAGAGSVASRAASDRRSDWRHPRMPPPRHWHPEWIALCHASPQRHYIAAGIDQIPAAFSFSDRAQER